MNDSIQTILDDPAASEWLKTALRAALARDPVDVVNDAEVLCETLKQRLDDLFQTI
jgi:hypothetical protein